MKNFNVYSRRHMLKSAAAFACLAPLASCLSVFGSERRKYQIGACDWSMGKKNNVESLLLAKKIGLNGVQLDLGHPDNRDSLWHKNVQEDYKKAVEETGVQISSLAIGQLNKVPYKSASETEAWVSVSIDVAKAMGTKVILLAFFAKGDLRNDEAGKREVIRRLKKVAPKAEKAGVILGIESLLSADEQLEIIHAVGSENVRVYYDVANSQRMGYDIYDEMKRLGKEYICEIHAKERGNLLGQGKIDFVRVKNILNDMDYDGWLIIEGAIPKGTDVLTAYTANNKYLGSVFNVE